MVSQAAALIQLLKPAYTLRLDHSLLMEALLQHTNILLLTSDLRKLLVLLSFCFGTTNYQTMELA